MSIFDVFHQERALRLLRFASAGARMPHAYIFHGPEGVGRELCARNLAAARLCEAGGEDACGRCSSCAMSVAGTHPDYHIIYRELNRQHPKPEVRGRKAIFLGIDVIRHFVIERVARQPMMGRGKVFVLREAEKMNPAAQNALLKTLEEPPPATIVILVSVSLDALLPTVRSRCQVLPFGLLPGEFVEERLLAMNESITADEARFCALHASGSLGVAQRHYDDHLIECDERMDALMGELGRVSAGALAKRVVEEAKALGECCKKRDGEISDTEAQRRGLKVLMSLMAMGVRDSLHACVGAGSEREGFYASLADRMTPRDATDAIRAIVTSERQLDRNVNVQLCVEGLLIRLARAMGG